MLDASCQLLDCVQHLGEHEAMPAASTAASSAPVATAAAVAAVRRFNRFYTRLLGLLDEHLLASDWSLTEVRVLYELAQRAAAAPMASTLARELAIDAAYLSRLLRRFDERGLLSRRAARTGSDARSRPLALTAAGRAAFTRLDRASDRQVAALLEPLGASQAAEVAGAMRRIETLLGSRRAGGSASGAAMGSTPAAVPSAPVLLRDLEIGDLGWIARRQGQLYADEYGWDQRFEALVAKILAEFVEGFDRRRERAWVADCEGRIVGSVFCVAVSRDEAKLRLLYVEPELRGIGLGARLTDECIRFARARGYRRLTLWTNDVLLAARHIYESRGFVLEREERHRSFGKRLVGQYWALTL